MVVKMKDEKQSGPYGHQNDPAGKFEVEVSLKLPEGTLKKPFLFETHDKIWWSKLQVINELAKGVKDALNYGFYEPPCNGRSGKFLDEERTFLDYPQRIKPAELEFKYKRRVYKSVQYDAKALRKVHTKGNLKKLLEAVASNSVSHVTKLTDRGLDPNFQDEKTGETPLTIAVMGDDRTNMIMTLVNGGAHLDYRAGDGLTAVHKAAIAGKVQSVKTLLDLGASPNYRCGKNLTPLYCTVLYGSDPYVTELLLNDHADMGLTDHQGLQEIHHACKNGLVQHLEHLVFYGADINATTASGNTPLHTTALSNREDCARVLLFRGAKRDKLNYANQSAYDMAAVAGNNDLAEFIKTFSDGQIVKISGKPTYSTRRRKPQSKPRASSLFDRAPSDTQLSARSESPSPGSSTNSIASSFGDTISLDGHDARGEGKMHRSLSMGSDTSDSSYCSESESGAELSPNEHRSRAKERKSRHHGSEDVDWRSAPPVKLVSGAATMRKRLYASMPGKKFIAVKDYRPNIGGELALQKGDIVEVLYVGEKGFWEGRVGNKNGWFPHACVEELKKDRRRPKTLFGRPQSLTSMFTKSDVMYHSAETLDRGPGHPARVVTLNRGRSGFGFQMRGADSQTPRLNFQPTPDFPALQYIGEVEEGGEAEMKGVKCGDFILEVEGEDVTTATHTHVVELIKSSGGSVTLKIVTVPNTTDMNGLENGNGLAYGSLRGTGKRPPPLPARDPSTTLTLGRMRTSSRPSLFEAGLSRSHEDPANYQVDSVITVCKESPYHTLQRVKPSSSNSRSAAQFKFNSKSRHTRSPKYEITENQRSRSMQNISAPPSYESISGKRPLSSAVPFEIPRVPGYNPRASEYDPRDFRDYNSHFARSMSEDPNMLSVKRQLQSHSAPDMEAEMYSRQRSPSPLSFEGDRNDRNGNGNGIDHDDLDHTLVATPVNATVVAQQEPGYHHRDHVAVIATPVEVTMNTESTEKTQNGIERRHSLDSGTPTPVSLSSALEQAVAARTRRMDKKLARSAETFEREMQNTARKISAPAKVTTRKRASTMDKVRSDIMAQLNDDSYHEGYISNERPTTLRSSSVEERTVGRLSSQTELDKDVTDGRTSRARTLSSSSNSSTHSAGKPLALPPKPPPAPPPIDLNKNQVKQELVKPVKPAKKASIPMTPVLTGLITTDALKAKKGKLKSVETETPKTSKPFVQPVGRLGSHGNKPAPTFGAQHSSMLAKAVAARAAKLAVEARDHSESPSSWDDEPSDSPRIPINRSPPKGEVKKTAKKPPPPVPPKKKSPVPMQKPTFNRSESETSPRRTLWPPRAIDAQSERIETLSLSGEEDRTMMLFDDIIRREVESENWSLNSWNSSDSSSLTDVVTPPVSFLSSSDDGRGRKSSGGSNSRPWYEYSSGSPSEESLNASSERINRNSYSQEDIRGKPGVVLELRDEVYSSQESVERAPIPARQETNQETALQSSVKLELVRYDPRDRTLIEPAIKSAISSEPARYSPAGDQTTSIRATRIEATDFERKSKPEDLRIQTPTEDEEDLVEKYITTSTGLKIKLMLKKDRSGSSTPERSPAKSPSEPAFDLPAPSPLEHAYRPASSPPKPALLPKPSSPTKPPVSVKPARPPAVLPKPAMSSAVSPPPLETDIDSVMESRQSGDLLYPPNSHEVEESLGLPPPPDDFVDGFGYSDIPYPSLPPPPDFVGTAEEESFDALPAPTYFDDADDGQHLPPPDFAVHEVISAPAEFGFSSKSEPFAIKPLIEWTCDDVCEWLMSIGLGQYVETFRENDIQGCHLPELTKVELKELGIKSLGHRMTVENSVAKLCHPLESSC